MDFIEGVRKFNLAAGRTEGKFDPRMVAFHIGMQLEELAEVLRALLRDGDEAHELHTWKVRQLEKTMDAIGGEFKRGFYDEAARTADRLELLDGCVDVMVVSIGNVMSQGADIEGACDEVNRANLSKLVDGRVIKDENGKILKPSGWIAPNMHPFVSTT
jgi:predicted HAD superfamily Cof-like phosphohydrolase